MDVKDRMCFWGVMFRSDVLDDPVLFHPGPGEP